MSSTRYDVDAAPAPHPAFEAVLDDIASRPTPTNPGVTPGTARALMHRTFPRPDDPESVDEVLDLRIAECGVPVRVYVPEDDPPHPALVFVHGGGWVIGDLDTHDPQCRAFAARTGVLVASVDYGRSPEHQFPAPLEDCYAALAWLHDEAQALRVDTARIAVGGDSAGGNLSAALALLARDRDGPEIAHQLLLYPVTNHAFDTESYAEFGDGFFLTEAEMRWFWDHYLPSDIHGRNPYASPLQATSLTGLPPATVMTCGFDPLRDEGAAYAARLDADGVPVTFLHREAAIHGAAQFVVDPLDLAPGRAALDQAVAALETALRD